VSDETRSLIGAGAAFEGLLAYRGAVRIDGRLVGEVVASGALEIGEAGEVRANVQVDELVVAGLLEGEAVASRRIELRPSARVVGGLEAPTVVLADGCRVEGSVRTARAALPEPGSRG
jgi:cytoskeletal protein CcmA (bactofilin family)